MKRLMVSLLLFCLASVTNAALVSHWTFDEDDGNIAFDSENGYHGLIHGAARTTGIIGGALDFDGIDDYVYFGDIDEFEFGDNDFSICAWFYTQGPHSGGSGIIINKYDYGGNQRQWSLRQYNTGEMEFYTSPDGSTHEVLVSTGSEYQGRWVHMACVREDSTKYLYINGVLDVTGITAGVVAGKNSNVYVGCRENECSKSRFFNGIIDDVRVYNHALSPAEIQELIPEPATLFLLGLGAVMLGRKR